MNVVDSSAWLEYMADGKNAGSFAKPIENVRDLIVPSITILEVYKRIAQQRDEAAAIVAIAAMCRGSVVELDAEMAILAAQTGLRYKLPLADSVVLATAISRHATLWTQDADFKDVPGVRYVNAKTGR